MKNNIIKFIGLFIAIAFIASCEKEAFEEYSSVPVADAPGLTLTIDSNTDSAITVSYNMNMAGRVTLAVLPASVDTPAIADMQGRPTADYYYYKHDEGDAQATITYEGLEPYTEYRVYGVGQNLDGVFSEIIMTEAVRTEDFANPVITAFSPAKGELVFADSLDVVLTFSEPVTYVSGKEIRLFADYGTFDEVIIEDNIIVDGKTVTLKHGKYTYEDYINLTMEEGAFVDASGNQSSAVLDYPATPNYYFETSYAPAVDLVGEWTLTENSLYDGDANAIYDVTISLGNNPNELVIDTLWSALTLDGEMVVSMTIELDQETGGVICPLQDTDLDYSGGYSIYQVYSNYWSVNEGIYGSYTNDEIVIDAKLYAEGFGIFDQVQFVLVPSTGKRTENYVEAKKPVIREYF